MPEQHENEGWQIALWRIEEALRSNSIKLHLIGLNLRALPEWLGELSQLLSLKLSRNELTALPESLGQLNQLQNLDLRDNQLMALPNSLGQLGQLQNLNLDINKLTALPESLGKLSQLDNLNLHRNQLTALPESLGQLNQLRSLDLSHNQLTALPQSLGQLSQLLTFFLNDNQLTVLPESFGRLNQLQNLNLSRNQLTTLPESLGQLNQLQNLNLSRNQLTAIPESLAQLSQLLTLFLNDNQFTVLPESLGQLNQLRSLDLSRNQLTALPESLGQLGQLQSLNLSNNKLTALPESLAALPMLTHLFLHGNPGLGIPDEILGPPWREVYGGAKGKQPKPAKEILSYYFGKQAGARPLNEAKLILVGQGGVGKTSLVKTLIGQEFKEGERTTEGIKISDWACSLGSKETVMVHIWDFGGQEMMHATHQFFLTARSLYLLVLNRRPGGIDREADYWFRLVRAFGGKDAPVIVVLNKQKSEYFDVNRGNWVEKYAGNIKGFVETDCEDAKSIMRLREKLQEELQAMQSLKASFPVQWFAIKDELSQMSSQFVTYADYQQICAKHGEKDPDKQTSLAGFLHDLGIALNYKDDPRLRFAYVLKPEWVTEGIYALLHAFVKNKGLFTRAEAERVLKPKGYRPEAADFILGLMEQFEVSFPLGDGQKRSLIPQLLDDQQPDEARQFDAAKCLNFGYTYEIVPEGLLPRFIVRTHHISDEKGRWKSGVILHDPDTKCRALVRADSTAGLVSIHVGGPEQERRELLAIIRYNFRVIHADYEFKPDELVYPPGVPGKHFTLSELTDILRDDASSTVSVVLPDRKVIKPTVASLVEPVKDAEPLNLFLSYAHADEKYVSELRKDLKLMERNGLIRTWYDRALTAGEKWEARILQELDDADVIVCQISRDFLNSDFCVLKELDRAIQRKEAGEAELVAYLLEHCGWREVPKLVDFQVLPRDAKPLSESKGKQDRYWRAVAEGIQEVIKKLRQQRPLRSSRELIRASADRKA
jgi:internalin A